MVAKMRNQWFQQHVKQEIVKYHESSEMKCNLPCPSFNIAAVIKTLNTFLKTSELKIELGCPEPFQATIIIA